MRQWGQRWFAVAGVAAVGAVLVPVLASAGWAPMLAIGLLVVAGLAVWRGAAAAAAEGERLEQRARRAEAAAGAARSAAERLGTYLQRIDEPLLVCDGRQSVTLVNEAGLQWLDMAGADVLGRSIDEVFTNAEVLSLHARAARGEGCRRRVTIAGENGYRVADVSAVPVPRSEGDGAGGAGEEVSEADAQDGGGGVLLILRDVTELSRVLQIRTDFAANASHELRTPIAALRGAVDTLNGRAGNDEAMRARLLSMLDENVTRLEDLIRDLLDLSRLEALEGSVRLALVPASELVRVLEQGFEPMCERGSVSLRFELDPELERLRTDRNLLTIILRNLIENAIKFSQPGDEVLVRGSVEPAGAAGASRTCVFEVIDQGQGIPLPMQQRIFERFYQVDTSRDGSKIARGTGLGLAIVKHAVRTLGGAIRVKSVWQRGTTMTVELVGAVPPGRPGPG